MRLNKITPGYKSDTNFHTFAPEDIKIFMATLSIKDNRRKETKCPPRIKWIMDNLFFKLYKYLFYIF